MQRTQTWVFHYVGPVWTEPPRFFEWYQKGIHHFSSSLSSALDYMGLSIHWILPMCGSDSRPRVLQNLPAWTVAFGSMRSTGPVRKSCCTLSTILCFSYFSRCVVCLFRKARVLQHFSRRLSSDVFREWRKAPYLSKIKRMRKCPWAAQDMSLGLVNLQHGWRTEIKFSCRCLN